MSSVKVISPTVNYLKCTTIRSVTQENSWSQSHRLQLSHSPIATQICCSLRFVLYLYPSFSHHCTHALQASVFSRLDSTAGPCLSPCLGPSRTPVYSLFCSHGSFSKMQMWAPHFSSYTLPCLPVPSVLNLSASECQSRLHSFIR